MTNTECACKACGGSGWTVKDWDEEDTDFGEEVPCPHCDAQGVEF